MLPGDVLSSLRHCAIRCDHAGSCGSGSAQPKWHRGRHRWALYFLRRGRIGFGTSGHATAMVDAPCSLLLPPGHALHEVPEPHSRADMLMAWLLILPAAGWENPLLSWTRPMPVAARDAAAWDAAWADLLSCFDGMWRPKDPRRAFLAGPRAAELLLMHLEDAAASRPRRSGPAVPDWLATLIETLAAQQARHRWRVGGLARLAGCSVAHLRRLCQRHWQRSPARLLRGARVRYVLQHLSGEREMDIATASARALYADGDLFGRHCRAETGCSPRKLLARLAPRGR